jgi:hypothetical protein
MPSEVFDHVDPSRFRCHCNRRARIIHAEGEFNSAAQSVEAAAFMTTQPMTLKLRYLQFLPEIGVEKNTTIVFPLPSSSEAH